MISNHTILEKIEIKTATDPEARKMLIEMLELESEHKQYSKPFKKLIEDDVKRGEDEV